MLKVDIHEEQRDGKPMKHCEIEAAGDVLEIVKEVGRVVLAVYASINRQLPFSAGFFRYAMKRAMEDPAFWEMEDEVFAGEGISIITSRDKKK